MDNATLTPLVFTTLQNTYITQLSSVFGEISHYAASLFYILASLEIALFGIIWALKQQEMVGKFLFKIIKLGFVFFLISHYPTLLNILINGLTQISFQVVPAQTASAVFGPDLLWKYGFDSAISLLSLSVQYGNANFGMTSIYLILGFGILFLFALIACQVILLLITFYLLSLLALLFLPFGAFLLTENLFGRSLQAVFKTAVKIFAMILMIGIGMGVWSNFNPGAFVASTTLDQPLGLLFTTLIIAILTWKVPTYAAEAVGNFGGDLFKIMGESGHPSAPESSSTVVSSQPAALGQIAAASSMTSQSAVAMGGSMSSPSGGSTSVSVQGSASSIGGSIRGLSQNVSELTKAVKIQKNAGISKKSASKLKRTFE